MTRTPVEPEADSDLRPRSRAPWLVLIGCAIGFLIGLIRPGSDQPSTAAPGSKSAGQRPVQLRAPAPQPRHRATPRPASVDSAASATEIVAEKLARFARSRRDLAYALARRHNVTVPADVERFFAAVESGIWPDIQAAFEKINGGDSSASHSERRSPEVVKLWPAIIDAFGTAEQVHDWPAQELLDYGNAILGALRPGMVYVGGTDNGRWIPELLNETTDGERHIVITQNGLAASDYLDYVRLQYDDRLATLSEDDSKRAFEEYVTDARRRLEHDQQFPHEPKQIRPGEDVRLVDGKTHVGGQVAVMAINEKLLVALMEKNPELDFAIQESFPLQGTYADALPLGPLMELNARDEQNAFTAERAADLASYWRNTAEQLRANPSPASDSALKSYSHDAVSAANLLAAHDFTSEAQAAYQLAAELWADNPEPVAGLARLLARQGQEQAGRELWENFQRRRGANALTGQGTEAPWVIAGPPPAP
jgi:hypothetical protein